MVKSEIIEKYAMQACKTGWFMLVSGLILHSHPYMKTWINNFIGNRRKRVRFYCSPLWATPTLVQAGSICSSYHGPLDCLKLTIMVCTSDYGIRVLFRDEPCLEFLGYVGAVPHHMLRCTHTATVRAVRSCVRIYRHTSWTWVDPCL